MPDPVRKINLSPYLSFYVTSPAEAEAFFKYMIGACSGGDDVAAGPCSGYLNPCNGDVGCNITQNFMYAAACDHFKGACTKGASFNALAGAFGAAAGAFGFEGGAREAEKPGEQPWWQECGNSCEPGHGIIDGEAQYHIISGNSTGGGHKWPGQPGKTVFPPSWDTDKILDGVAEVATNPSSSWKWQKGAPGSLYTKKLEPSRIRIEGVYDGVKIRVIYEPATNRIVTGFPIG